MDEIGNVLRLLFGSEMGGAELTIVQMAARAVVVYIVTLLVVRLGKKRFLGKATAFDVILGIMLGSIVSRAITGNAPFLPALAAAVLIALHWSFSALRFVRMASAGSSRASPAFWSGTVRSIGRKCGPPPERTRPDRKSTRLNSSH